MKTKTAQQIPAFFKPILWSYDFEKLDSQKDQREIILQTINYGNLVHWSWILKNYGKTTVQRIIEQGQKTKLRPGARRLAEIIFGK